MNKQKIINFFSGGSSISDINIKIKFLVVNSFALVGSSFAFIFSIVNFAKGNCILAIFELIATTFTLISIYYLKKTKKINIASSYILVIMLLLFFILLISNKGDKSVLFWFFTFPPLAIFLKGKKTGFYWIICQYIIIYTTYFINEIIKINKFPFILYDFIILSASLFAVSLLIYFYESLKNKLLVLIEKQKESVIEKKLMEEQYKIAESIQRSLMPQEDLILENIEITGYYRPANSVGGDYYDYFKIDDEKIAVILCDVAGKGVSGAIVMVNIRSVFHDAISKKLDDPCDIIKLINKKMYKDLTIDMFVTLSVFIFSTKTNELKFSNAGHGPFIYYSSKENSIIEVEFNTLPVGVSQDDSNYKSKSLVLNQGDIILGYTDGLIERLNNKYDDGKSVLFDLIVNNNLLCLNELKAKIINEVELNTEKIKHIDDTSFLICKIK